MKCTDCNREFDSLDDLDRCDDCAHEAMQPEQRRQLVAYRDRPARIECRHGHVACPICDDPVSALVHKAELRRHDDE